MSRIHLDVYFHLTRKYKECLVTLQELKYGINKDWGFNQQKFITQSKDAIDTESEI